MPAAASTTSSAPLDGQGRVRGSVHCRSCGYDLKGLRADATCPECAAPIARSLQADLLRFCDPAWLRGHGRGYFLIAAGSVATLGLTVAMTLVAPVMATVGGTGWLTLVMTALGLLGGGLAVVVVVGAWMATAPEAAMLPREPALSARRLARWCIVASIFGTPLQLLTGTRGVGGGASGAVEIFVFGLGMAASLVSMVGWVAMYVHMGRLAARIPRPGLRRQLRIVMVGFATFTCLAMSTGFAVMLGAATGGTGVGLAFAGGACVGAGGWMIFEAWAVVLFFLFARLFTRFADEADRGDVLPAVLEGPAGPPVQGGGGESEQ